jgi:hypothetical protein
MATRAREKLRGGADYHADRVWKSQSEFEEALDDMEMAANCRRAFSAMQRATRALGRMNDDAYSFNSPSEHRSAVEHAQNNMSKSYVAFVSKCHRKSS